MPHRRRLHNLAPPLPPPPPPPPTAFDLAEDPRLPLLADYPRLHDPAGAPPPSTSPAQWSAAFTDTATSSATTATAAAGCCCSSSSTTLPAPAVAGNTWVRRSREGYYLQLSLAIRITSEAFLAGVPPELLLRRLGPGPAVQHAPEHHAAADSPAVSYRLWVRHRTIIFAHPDQSNHAH